jgi:hypothetical protein
MRTHIEWLLRNFGLRQLMIIHEPAKKTRKNYSFAYSAQACLKTGMAGSASFQSVRKAW